MKRIFLVVMCFVFCTFYACSSKPSSPLLDFSANVSICDDYGLEGLQAEVNSTMQGAVTIKVTTDNELWGLTYKWSDGFELIYEGLHCKTQKGYMPEGAFAEVIYNVLCALSREKECKSFSEGVALYEGECRSGYYKVTTDSKGYIQSISVEEINFFADFKYR